MTLTVLLGGARSGKSALAVELGRRHGDVTFIATAPAVDDDMAERIERHRRERPAHWITVEEQVDLAVAITSAGEQSLVIVDCLTLWTSNMMWHGHSDTDIIEATQRTVDAAVGHRAPVIVISNEVGLGLHPDTALGRTYRDVHGRVNQRWAAAADHPLFVVAGTALRLCDPIAILDDHEHPAT